LYTDQSIAKICMLLFVSYSPGNRKVLVNNHIQRTSTAVASVIFISEVKSY